MSRFGAGPSQIIVPYFFEDAVTVNSECYVNMIWEFFWSQLHCQGFGINTCWFQQDGGIAHAAHLLEVCPGWTLLIW